VGVLIRACKPAAHGTPFARMPIELNVNLSGKQFSRATWWQQVKEALQISGRPPVILILEITERVVMEKPRGGRGPRSTSA